MGGAADVPVTLELTTGRRTIVLEKALQLTDGAGTFWWVVPEELAAGSYTLTAKNNVAKDPTTAVVSSAFTVGRNPTIAAARHHLGPDRGRDRRHERCVGHPLRRGTLHVGDRTSITINPGNATGAYAVDLYRGTSRIARVASGGDIVGVSSVVWLIPSGMSLTGTGYTFVVDTTVNAPFETSSTFDIASSGVSGLQYGYDTPLGWFDVPDRWGSALRNSGNQWTIRWSSAGYVGPVSYELVPSGSTTPIVLETRRPNEGRRLSDFPRADIPAGTYTFRVVPMNPAALPGEQTITLLGPGWTGGLALSAGDAAQPLSEFSNTNFGEEQGFTTQLGRVVSLVTSIPTGSANSLVDVALIDPSSGRTLAKLATALSRSPGPGRLPPGVGQPDHGRSLRPEAQAGHLHGASHQSRGRRTAPRPITS